MVGVVEGLLYGYKAGLDLDEVIQAVGAGAAGTTQKRSKYHPVCVNLFHMIHVRVRSSIPEKRYRTERKREYGSSVCIHTCPCLVSIYVHR